MPETLQTVFVTRRQHERMCQQWQINGEEQKAFLAAKHKWGVVGVQFKTSNRKLLTLIEKVRTDT